MSNFNITFSYCNTGIMDLSFLLLVNLILSCHVMTRSSQFFSCNIRGWSSIHFPREYSCNSYLLDIQQTPPSFNISLDRDHKLEKLRRKLFGIGKYHFDKFGGKPQRMFLVDCQTDQNFSHFLWHLNHKSFIEELLLTNDQSCDTWPLLDFVLWWF